MGCEVSVEVVQPIEPEDPFEALLFRIKNERKALSDGVKDLDQSNAELRYLQTTVLKARSVCKELQELHDDETDMFTALAQHIAGQDADDLFKASDGIGTDEEKMGQVIVSRLPDMIVATDKIYKKKHGKTLEELVMKEGRSLVGLLTGGLSDFGRFMSYRVMPQGRRDALLIHKCVAGIGCDDKNLLEVLSTRTNAELKEALFAYAHEYEGEDIIARIKDETGGFLKKNYGAWVDCLVEFDRDETTNVPNNVDALAEELYEAGAGKTFGCDEDVFLRILCKANELTCIAIRDAYNSQHPDRDFYKDIEKKMGGDLEFAILARVKPKIDFFCDRIRSATKGFGTDEEGIARVLVQAEDLLKLEAY